MTPSPLPFNRHFSRWILDVHAALCNKYISKTKIMNPRIERIIGGLISVLAHLVPLKNILILFPMNRMTLMIDVDCLFCIRR